MKLEVYRQPNLFELLKDEWNNLVVRSSANRIFSTWEWQATWWEVYHPGDLWVLVCRADDNSLLGIAPWFIGTTETGDRFVATIGCKEVTDYLDVIIDRDFEEPVIRLFAEYLAQNTQMFDRIEFCNVSEDSISCRLMPAVLEACGFSVRVEKEDVCPIIRLPDSWADYLNMLDKKQRHELRRKLRRTHSGSPQIDWYIVGPEHNPDEEMDHFLTLMAASDPNKARFLQDPQNTAFFRKLVTVLLPLGWLQLIFLTVNGHRAAAYLNFDYNRHISVYNSGLKPDEFGHLSPGIVLLAFNIQHAIQTQHEIFDFLQGDETYKYHMGAQDILIYNIIAEQSTK